MKKYKFKLWHIVPLVLVLVILANFAGFLSFYGDSTHGSFYKYACFNSSCYDSVCSVKCHSDYQITGVKEVTPYLFTKASSLAGVTGITGEHSGVIWTTDPRNNAVVIVSTYTAGIRPSYPAWSYVAKWSAAWGLMKPCLTCGSGTFGNVYGLCPVVTDGDTYYYRWFSVNPNSPMNPIAECRSITCSNGIGSYPQSSTFAPISPSCRSVPAMCGDGYCNGVETVSSCSTDCKSDGDNPYLPQPISWWQSIILWFKGLFGWM